MLFEERTRVEEILPLPRQYVSAMPSPRIEFSERYLLSYCQSGYRVRLVVRCGNFIAVAASPATVLMEVRVTLTSMPKSTSLAFLCWASKAKTTQADHNTRCNSFRSRLHKLEVSNEYGLSWIRSASSRRIHPACLLFPSDQNGSSGLVLIRFP